MQVHVAQVQVGGRGGHAGGGERRLHTPRPLGGLRVGGIQRTQAYTHDFTVLADSSHGDSHVGSVSPAATRTRTLALTLTRTLTLALTLTLTLTLTRT